MAKTTKKKKDIEEELVSVSEVWDVLEFAKSMSGYNGIYPGILTPELMNQRLKDISFNPIGATETELNNALSDPKNSEAQLRSFVENLELVSSPFRRILSYMASHLAFDLTYSVTNIKKKEEYRSAAFLKDQKLVFEFLDNFDYKQQFKSVVKQLLRNEMYVCSPREDGEKMVLQELPLDRCRITAKWDYGFLVAFDFTYFLQPGVDIRLYPKFFRKKFNELWGTDSIGKHRYNPNISPESRGNSQFVYWVDLPPEIGWVFKFDPSLVASVPYYASLIPDFMNQSVIRNLQKNMNIAAASKILVGQVPLLKEAKANVSDMVAIKAETLGKFLALVKSALADSVKVAAAPLEDMKAISFDSDPIMYDEYLRTATSASGVNAPLIYSGKLKANAIESQLSFQSDSLIMETLYPQFNNFMEYYARKRTKTYKFVFEFEGNNYYLDRKARFDYAKGMFDIGMVLPQKFSAARGMAPQTLFRQMEESNGMGFMDMLTPPSVKIAEQTAKFTPAPTTNPSSSADIKDGKGRPRKEDSELSEEGSQTRDGGNLDRGGNI
jgi:hypothetical protein